MILAEAVQIKVGGTGEFGTAGWVILGLLLAPLVVSALLLATARWWR